MLNNVQHTPAINQPPVEGENNVVVWLCATPYDDISKFLAGLLKDFPALPKPTTVFTLAGPSSFEELIDSAERGNETNVILVFSGHGGTDALLGPPRAGGAASAESKPSNFYDLDQFDLGPASLIAFCCSAGSGLGEAFKEASGRSFIGFTAPIGFVTAGGVYFDTWQKILHQSTVKIMSTSDSRELRTLVRNVYLEAYHYFKSPDGQKNEWWFWMTLLLRGHLEALRVHGH